MKKIHLIILSLIITFPFISSAARYSSNCPAEAKSILTAIGGCSTIDKVVYSNIYTKCCMIVPPNPMFSKGTIIIPILILALIVLIFIKKNKNLQK